MTQLAPVHDLPTDPKTGEPLSPAYRRRVSSKVRTALKYRIDNACTWEKAADHAGCTTNAIYKAIKQPHVKALFDQMKFEYIQNIEQLKGVNKARAYEVARELLEGAKTDSVKARMVEFLSGERHKTQANQQVQVNIGAQNHSGGRYSFVRPGQKLVEITVEDGQSPVDNAQPIDITPESENG